MNIIALDISKSTADCHLKRSNGITDTLKIENTLSGCLKLHKWIKSQRVRKVIIAMEATGIYYQIVADYFAKYYPVTVINPFKISSYAESQLSRTKTDKADAKLIAEYTSRHTDKLHSSIISQQADKNSSRSSQPYQHKSIYKSVSRKTAFQLQKTHSLTPFKTAYSIISKNSKTTFSSKSLHSSIKPKHSKPIIKTCSPFPVSAKKRHQSFCTISAANHSTTATNSQLLQD